ncbi:triose-phosphate isomerase [Sutcliffiella rhizosphaerae]|uniref:Triosephosphate isomerase n=1 Tax=Sutcliffiella rhizosphaerae TaxID=2880967 RepID=A0ABM8YJA0_9BACI|nr:triose-phosphate isomerase [Sutcliffiella rhizosphaerae]CAG9619997.1 Triosephosphate isomerase [Sutcliffiella rhizosphaerae]
MNQPIKAYIKQLVQEAVEQSLSQGKTAISIGRKKYVIANWKMNQNLQETLSFFQKIQDEDGVEVVICPPAPLLLPAHTQIMQEGKKLSLGAQNVHQEEKGAYTGEIAANLVKEFGCQYTLIGHSERRQYFQEDDQTISLKVKRALQEGLTPVVCIGETLEQKHQAQTEKVLTSQILLALEGVNPADVIFAYEPVWAIGTGESASPEEAQKMHHYIRAVLSHIDKKSAEQIAILYGGSVNETNAKEYALMPDIDGVLVGGASLKVDAFQKIITVFAKGD